MPLINASAASSPQRASAVFPSSSSHRVLEPGSLRSDAMRHFDSCNEQHNYKPYLQHLSDLNEKSSLREFVRYAAQAVSLYPDDCFYLLMYAKALVKSGKNSQAFSLVKTILEKDPNSVEAVKLMITVHTNLNLKPYRENYISIATSQSLCRINGIVQPNPNVAAQLISSRCDNGHVKKWIMEFIEANPFSAIINYVMMVPFGFPISSVYHRMKDVKEFKTAEQAVFYLKNFITFGFLLPENIKEILEKYSFEQHSQNSESFADYLFLLFSIGESTVATELCDKYLNEIDPYNAKVLIVKIFLRADQGPLLDKDLNDCELFIPQEKLSYFQETLAQWDNNDLIIKDTYRNFYFRRTDFIHWICQKDKHLREENLARSHVALNFLLQMIEEEGFVNTPLYSHTLAEMANVESNSDFQAWQSKWMPHLEKALSQECVQTSATYLIIATLWLDKGITDEAKPLVDLAFRMPHFSDECIKRRVQTALMYSDLPFVARYIPQCFEEYYYQVYSSTTRGLTTFNKATLICLAFYSKNESFINKVSHLIKDVYEQHKNATGFNKSLAICLILMAQQALKSSDRSIQTKATEYYESAYKSQPELLTAAPLALHYVAIGKQEEALVLFNKFKKDFVIEGNRETLMAYAKLLNSKGAYLKSIEILNGLHAPSDSCLDLLITAYYNLQKYELCLKAIDKVSQPTMKHNIIKSQIEKKVLEAKLDTHLKYYDLMKNIQTSLDIIEIYILLARREEAKEFFQRIDTNYIESSQMIAFCLAALALEQNQFVFDFLTINERSSSQLVDIYIDAAWALGEKEIVRSELSKLSGYTDSQIKMLRSLPSSPNESPAHSTSFDSPLSCSSNSPSPTSRLHPIISKEERTKRIAEKKEENRRLLKLGKIKPVDTGRSSPSPMASSSHILEILEKSNGRLSDAAAAAAPPSRVNTPSPLRQTRAEDIQAVIWNPVLFDIKEKLTEEDIGFIVGAKTLLVHLEDTYLPNTLPEDLLLAERTFEIYKIASILCRVEFLQARFKPLRNWIRHNPHLVNFNFVDSVAALFKTRKLKESLEFLIHRKDDRFTFKLSDLGLEEISRDHRIEKQTLIECLEKYKTLMLNCKEKAMSENLRHNIQLYRAIQGFALLAGSAARDLNKKHQVTFANQELAMKFIKRMNLVAHIMGSSNALRVKDFNTLQVNEAQHYVCNIGFILNLNKI